MKFYAEVRRLNSENSRPGISKYPVECFCNTQLNVLNPQPDASEFQADHFLKMKTSGLVFRNIQPRVIIKPGRMFCILARIMFFIWFLIMHADEMR